jgi:S-disulfanyl-L-cysteine oxidoreductase SoxD
MKIRFVLVGVTALITALTFYAVVGAQAPASVLAGAYTAAQAKRGADLYAKECAACHGDTLAGMDPIPALAGADFVSHYKTVGELFDKTSTTMPAIAPGSLTAEQVADVIAHILSVNKYPAGSTDLPSKVDALTAIKIEPSK